MKLVILTAIKEFEKEIKQILIQSQTKVFSYLPATGYKDISLESFNENWFGEEINEDESIIFLAFVPIDYVNNIYEKVEKFNANDEFTSRIHVATIELEKSI